MSDAKPLALPDFLPINERQKIQSIMAEAIIVDYGIVRKVNGNFVDVEHAVRRVTMPGIQTPSVVLDPMISKTVELLFPASSGMSTTWTVAVGDCVLLLGLQNALPSTEGLTESSAPAEFWHYSSQTLKAVPLWSRNGPDAAVEFGEANGKAFLRNQAQSLYTLLDDLESALVTFMGPASQASITAGNSSPAALAAALVALMAAFAASTTGMRTKLAQLLEA